MCSMDHMQILLNCMVSVCTLSTLTQLVSKYCKNKMQGHLQMHINFFMALRVVLGFKKNFLNIFSFKQS